MSNLYIRVRTSFFTHRKTIRLRALIGNDAFWIPPKLWAYAAENQPDGDMSGYSDVELGMLLGYVRNATSNATSMLQALKDVQFIDSDGHIHDWEEHNGYHSTYSERAKKAASVRWKKHPHTPEEEKKKKEKVESGDKHCIKHACSIASSITPVSNGQVDLLGNPLTEYFNKVNGVKKEITDEQWLNQLCSDETYRGIEVRVEYGKMLNWCKVNRKSPTRRRFTNWLNRCERPLSKQTVTPNHSGGF